MKGVYNGVTIDLGELARKLGIQAKTYHPKSSNPGQAYICCGQPVILVSDNEPFDKQRLIASHELGHLMLGHVGTWGSIPDRQDKPREEKEREAATFAAKLLQLIGWIERCIHEQSNTKKRPAGVVSTAERTGKDGQ